MLTFRKWLLNQKQRRDPIGVLARKMATVDTEAVVLRKRKKDEHLKWARIVTRNGKPEHVRAFNRAWREYQIIKNDA